MFIRKKIPYYRIFTILVSSILLLPACRRCDPPDGDKVTIITNLNAASPPGCISSNTNRLLTAFNSGGRNAFSNRSANTGNWFIEIKAGGNCPGDPDKGWEKKFTLNDIVVKTVNGKVAFEIQNCPIQTFSAEVTLTAPCETTFDTDCSCVDAMENPPQGKFRAKFSNFSAFSPNSVNKTFEVQLLEQPTSKICCN